MQLKLILGEALDIDGIKPVSKGQYLPISKHESVQSLTQPIKYVCVIPLNWKGRESTGWGYWQTAELPPGEVGGYGFECCQTAEEIDTLLQFDNALECLLKSVCWEHLSCRTDALWCYLESYPLIV